MRKFRFACLAVAVALPSTLLAATSAFGATKGTIHVYSLGSNNSATNPIIFTGVIGDYGTATSIDKNGKVDENGSYEKMVLKKGGFTVNATGLNAATANIQPTIDSSTCAGTFIGSGPTTVGKGTGAYQGIEGTVTITITSAFVLPKLKNGKCNMSQSAMPLASYTTITGFGPISFG